jgi:hypothetical protein
MPTESPPPARNPFARIRRLLEAVRGDHATIFARIHRERAWGDDGSLSGPGSTPARGADFRDDLLALLRALDTRVLLDAPCGDCAWIGPVADRVAEYIGVDVVPALIAANQARHATRGRSFLQADLTRDPLPRADVVLCRDCLVHFSTRDVRAALANLRRSGAQWLITTTFVGVEHNREIRTGDWRPLNLERPPFSLPPPEALVDERCLRDGGQWRDKRLGLWALQSLAV